MTCSFIVIRLGVLFVLYHLLFVFYHLLFVLYHLLFVLYHLLFHSPITDGVWKGTGSVSYDLKLKGLREFKTVMQTLNFVSGLHNCLKFSQPLSCLYQAMQTQEKSFLLLL